MKVIQASPESESIFYPVQKVPIVKIMPDFKAINQINHAVIVSVPKSAAHKVKAHELIVNFCSSKYNLVPNQEFVPTLEQILKNEGIEFKAKYTVVDHCRFFIDYIMVGSTMAVVKKDMVTPRVRVQNSYDGKLRLTINFGLYRVVCTNGLSVPVVGSGKNIRMTHTPYSSSARALEQAVDQIKEFTALSKDLIKPFRDMASYSLSEQKAIELVDAIIKDTRYPAKQRELAIQNIQKEQKDWRLPEPTLWTIYNGLNSVLSHNMEMSMDLHKREQVDAQILSLITRKYL